MLRALHNPVTKWFFRLREPEPGEVFLHHRRVFVLPTQAGWGCFLILLTMFFSAVNYNLSLGFGLTFLLAACAVIDMHMAFRNLAHLYLLAGRSPPVFAGTDAQFELQLINRRKHHRYAVWVGFIEDDLSGIEQPADIAANSSARITLSAPARQRGLLQAPRVRLQTRFPLGLLRAWSYWKPDASVLVYPRPEKNGPPLPLTGELLQEGDGAAGDQDFAGIRAYQAGDSLKRLAWRQIARLDTVAGSNLVSKHFEGGARSELLLDYASLPRHLDREMKLSRLTHWVLEAEARGHPYALRLGSLAIAAAIGPEHQQSCLRALALYEGP